MAKIKFTKGELKRQRDALRQYERYLPTLQLKKQQLQMEILRQLNALEEVRHSEAAKLHAAAWSGLLSDNEVNLRQWLRVKQAVVSSRNIAGVDLPVFQRLDFEPEEYDLFLTPPWVDAALDTLKVIISLRRQIGILQEGIDILRRELRLTSQRVNLFEKVKIPETTEAIRLIKIYIGDQLANAVGRSKIAKRKIESLVLEGASA